MSYWTEEQGKEGSKRKLAKGFISSARKKSRRWKKAADDDGSEEDIESNIFSISLSSIDITLVSTQSCIYVGVSAESDAESGESTETFSVCMICNSDDVS